MSRDIAAAYSDAYSRRLEDAVSDDVVLVDVADRVAVITLNRPEARNALNRAVRKALPAAIERCDADDDVDVMILTGTDPAFSAGGEPQGVRARGVPQGGGLAAMGGGGGGRRGEVPAAVPPPAQAPVRAGSPVA